MIYLSGTWSAWMASQCQGARIGIMITPDIGRSYLGLTPPWWAADNGCFARGAEFNTDAWLAWLAKIPPEDRSRCLFATAPDVVGDWPATWQRSRDVLPVLRANGWRACVVFQDGIESAGAIDWQAFDAVFIGGTTAWKLSEYARRLCFEARERGKWVHMGRVNSRRRLTIAREFGCDSVDGMFLAFGPATNLPKLRRWLTSVNAQQLLPWEPWP